MYTIWSPIGCKQWKISWPEVRMRMMVAPLAAAPADSHYTKQKSVSFNIHFRRISLCDLNNSFLLTLWARGWRTFCAFSGQDTSELCAWRPWLRFQLSAAPVTYCISFRLFHCDVSVGIARIAFERNGKVSIRRAVPLTFCHSKCRWHRPTQEFVWACRLLLLSAVGSRWNMYIITEKMSLARPWTQGAYTANKLVKILCKKSQIIIVKQK